MAPTPRRTAAARAERVALRRRDPRWRQPPVRVQMAFCINCDACIRACPPAFGAVFRHGHEVVVVAELCSGCGRCVAPVCPADCIVADPHPGVTPEAWWTHPFSADDPYLGAVATGQDAVAAGRMGP